ncbi:hypothetical protein RI129_002789 [Pyrocoelia pectoralis]|uniref:Uncharacterized protein n=1 Tax=Pyrocoelia pectoralis TaxID=417401 RepID=A0AAN7ZLX4_9COLE
MQFSALLIVLGPKHESVKVFKTKNATRMVCSLLPKLYGQISTRYNTGKHAVSLIISCYLKKNCQQYDRIEFLSKIGGRTGVEDGSKVAYKVIDHVFTSEVFMYYSWTGICRGKSGEKKTFQILDGILGVFFEVISLAYPSKELCDF